MDTFIGELADVREEFIPEMPEMLLGRNSCPNSIKGKLGHPAGSPREMAPLLMKVLESMSIFVP